MAKNAIVSSRTLDDEFISDEAIEKLHKDPNLLSKAIMDAISGTMAQDKADADKEYKERTAYDPNRLTRRYNV